jgi:acetylornithine deacetylase/succinyl-diaminopimelate desuccinylase-like protein
VGLIHDVSISRIRLIMRELITLSELVAIPSVTGDTCQVADYIEERYARLGHRVLRFGDNIAVYIPGSDQSKAFIESGHLDTVPPIGASEVPLSLRRDSYDEDKNTWFRCQ